MPNIVKHYPTPSTTTYYVGEFQIDDIFRVDFQRKITDQPIWGYGSREFDFIARGREIVTGNIIINFRYPGYLRNVIESRRVQEEKTVKAIAEAGFDPQAIPLNSDGTKSFYEGSEAHSRWWRTTPNGLAATADLQNTKITKDAIMNIIENSIKNRKYSNLSNDQTSGRIADSINEAKKFLIERHTNTADKNNELPTKLFASPLDQNEKLPLFNMDVRYGYQGIEAGFARRFNKINLIGESQVVQADSASSAQPLMEVYPFFCSSISVERFGI